MECYDGLTDGYLMRIQLLEPSVKLHLELFKNVQWQFMFGMAGDNLNVNSSAFLCQPFYLPSFILYQLDSASSPVQALSAASTHTEKESFMPEC